MFHVHPPDFVTIFILALYVVGIWFGKIGKPLVSLAENPISFSVIEGFISALILISWQFPYLVIQGLIHGENRGAVIVAIAVTFIVGALIACGLGTLRLLCRGNPAPKTGLKDARLVLQIVVSMAIFVLTMAWILREQIHP